MALQCEFPQIRDKQTGVTEIKHHLVRPCQGLENGEGVINKAAPAIGANLVISFCPNNKQTCDTQCVVTNDNCGLSVRAKFTRNSKIQAVLSRAPHHRMILLSDLCTEHIRSLRKALLRSLLLKYGTRLQHPFV